MDCDEAMEHLYTYLDGELTAQVKIEVRKHIDRCRDCFGHYEFERAFLQFLEARCKAQSAPGHLRRKIFQSIMLDQPGGNR
jgi:mycothiol system anti-sigma-R factor